MEHRVAESWDLFFEKNKEKKEEEDEKKKKLKTELSVFLTVLL